MTATRQARLKKAAALVPLALLSAAWTVSISTTGAPQASAGDTRPALPDGTRIPSEALQVPASVTAPGGGPLGVTGESATQIVDDSAASSIPSAALAAYQRAETVIDKADTTCHLPWQLLAAIGRIESDHGRASGNRLTADGVAEPGIFGTPLNGQAGTSRIVDTDAGSYDGDTQFDRAVGPMQFIPSTWSTVGVDADGDGRRDPQDIDDAALAAAVYLCAGTDDLSTPTGRSKAVYRYNHSVSYVATVLAVLQSYLAGDYTAAPNFTLPATYFEPDPAPARHARHTRTRHAQHPTHGSHGSNSPQQAVPSSDATSAPSTSGGSSSGGTGSSSTPEPPKATTSAPPVPSATAVTQPVEDVLSAAEALTLCSEQIDAIPDPLGLLDGAKQACADKVTGKTKSAALALIPNTLNGMVAWLGL
jgi:membrane-bound lytic murein transglycosylase B